MNMNFSVLLSIYYKETSDNFENCIQSITSGQTLLPDEIVLVEDGKLTDDLYQVISCWEEKLGSLLRRIPLENNVGLGKALNIGLSHCSNEWVFRMDTDDISFPDRFEKQAKYIQEHPEIDIFSTQVSEFEGDIGNVTGIKKVPLDHLAILNFAKWRSPFNHMAIAYKKSVIDAVGGYKHHQFMEDYNLWLRVLAAGYQSANLKESLVLVRAGRAMVERRRGLIYMKSEWQLFKLKQSLNFQSSLSAFSAFMLRFLPRLLPGSMLVKLYAILRTN